MKRYTPLKGETGVEKVEEIKKAITTTLQPASQTVYSASKIMAGLIKDYAPAFAYMDNENFPSINYVLKLYEGGDDPFIDAAVGSNTAAGTAIANSGKKGNMVRGKKVVEVDEQVYRDMFDGLTRQQREAEILNYLARIAAKEKLKQVWLGDTGGASYTLFDGFVKIINADAATVKPTVNTLTTIREVLRAGVRNIPEDYDVDEYMIYCNKKTYETYKEEITAGDNTLALTIEIDGRVITFDSKKFVVIPGLADTVIYMARKEDLVVIDGQMSVNVVDRVAELEIYRIIMRWWMHANLRNPAAIVQLTHTVDVTP